MDSVPYGAAALLLAAGFALGVREMNSPRTAVAGNALCAGCFLAGTLLTLAANGLLADPLLWAAICVGAFFGCLLAARATLIRMPQLVGLFNGLGGGASALAALVLLEGDPSSARPASLLSAVLALLVGAVTLGGSLVAAGKLARRLPERPMILPGHTFAAAGLLLGIGALAVAALVSPDRSPPLCMLAGPLALALGAILAVRVGGADMPVTISLLNSLSGFAGALAGFAFGEPLLVAAGGIVGAAGIILTALMSRAANRSLAAIVLGRSTLASVSAPGRRAPEGRKEGETGEAGNDLGSSSATGAAPEAWDRARVAGILTKAHRVVFVPGYGMAAAEAQSQVKRLMDLLEASGKDVRCAIHPLAGRMPGHMHVLLAEVDVPYEKLCDMKDINDDFASVDAVVVVGANDVVNPGASTAVNTPIHGMPVLRVEEARCVIVCNQDTRPGYSGVPNPLYVAPNSVLCLGDAAQTLKDLAAELEAEGRASA